MFKQQWLNFVFLLLIYFSLEKMLENIYLKSKNH